MGLQDRLDQICATQPFATSFHVRDLATGAVYARDADGIRPSASTRKISIMMAALRAVHQGRLDLAEPVTVTAEMSEGVASGTFQYMTPGFVITLRDAIVQMIIMSDNVCTGIVAGRLTLDELNDFCGKAGMTGTTHRFIVPPPDMPPDHRLDEVTTTTPADQGCLLAQILAGCGDAEVAARLGCTPELCQLGLQFLSWQKYRTMLPSQLPAGTMVAHKTGTGRRGRMDAGIVYRDTAPRFIIAVYTDQVPTTMPDGLPGYAAAFLVIGALARACWEAFSP